MPSPIEPSRTVAASENQSSSASSDRDETAPGTLRGTPSAVNFGPPAAVGEVGTLGPSYRVVKQLGQGGMGAVFLAVDTRLGRKLALKVMLPEFAADAAAKERFLREARAAALVSHDNVVTVYEADERDGIPYIAMQFLQGYPLDEYLKQKGAPPLPHVIRIARETAAGLAAAHALGLVHRDIKPANLWLEAPNGRVKVLDFGLAKPIGSDAELTKSGAVVGTPAYMSPEQARGLKVDHRSDLFSLGSVLYRLCTGRTPFAGPNVMAVLMALGTEEPDPVRQLNPTVPESLAQLIHQLLAKKPEDRPQTATEVAKRLRAILDQFLAPSASAAMPAADVPMTTAAGASTSQPVVVHSRPLQPPIVVPISVSARPENAFKKLGVGEPSEAPTEPATVATPPSRKERQTTGRASRSRKGIWAAAGLTMLMACAAAGIIISKIKNKDGSEAEIQLSENSQLAVKKDGPGTKPSAVSPSEVTNSPVSPHPGSLPTKYTNNLGMEFVLVPKGKSWLGGGDGQPGNQEIEIKQDFYLGKYEVTQEEWEKVTKLNPSKFKAVTGVKPQDQKRFPVEMVSWDDTQTFLKLLNEQTRESGWMYRLPTAAEWEYACRGGPLSDRLQSAFDFYFDEPTNTLLPDRANFNHGKLALKRTCPVGSYLPNRLGLHDMHGNVWEWCDDECRGPDGGSRRLGRGGCCNFDWQECRAAASRMGPTSFRYSDLGLRLARVPSPDLAAAEWALSVGGTVIVKDAAGEKAVSAAKDLPPGPFVATGLHLQDTGERVRDGDLRPFAHLPALTSLSVGNCPQITDAALEPVGEMTGLTNLGINGTRVTDDGLARLKPLSGLVTLWLSDTAITDTGLERLAGLGNLVTLDIHKTKVTAAGVAKLAKTLPKCKIVWDGGTVEPKK